MSKKEMIVQVLEDVRERELVRIFNQYLDLVNGFDDYIYHMDEFDEILSDYKPEEIARLIFYGNFNPNYDYFKFNGYGNLQSIPDYALGDFIDIEYVADHIIEYNDSCGNDDIQEILNNGEE